MIENKIQKDYFNRKIRRYLDYPKFLSFILEKSIYFASPYQFEDTQEAIVPDFTKAASEFKEVMVKPEIENLAEISTNLLKQQVDINRNSMNKYYVYYLTNNLIMNLFLESLKPKYNHLTLGNISMDITLLVMNNEWDKIEQIFMDLYSQRINCSSLLKKYFKDTALISCWNFNNEESDLLWKTYGNKGIAIETSIEKLEQGLDIQKNLTCRIDKVQYASLEDISKQINVLSLSEMHKEPELQDTDKYAFLKRKCYASEEELRVLIRDTSRYSKEKSIKGEYIKIKSDFENFIDKIIISPYSQQNELDVVKLLLLKLGYGILADKVEKSKIN